MGLAAYADVETRGGRTRTAADEEVVKRQRKVTIPAFKLSHLRRMRWSGIPKMIFLVQVFDVAAIHGSVSRRDERIRRCNVGLSMYMCITCE